MNSLKVAPFIGAMAFLCLFPIFLAKPSEAHSWYKDKYDPVWNNNCCGGEDCNEISGKFISADVEGYRINLTLEEARKINPHATRGLNNALVKWARVQPSEDSKYHICLMPNYYEHDNRDGIFCFFAPLGL
jgi:hypothetical protein